ncbi:MAG: glycosyltransferase [Erysipelotrichales bacterium]|nr:glycosyltransferase [Erysipelotrichales bacterium]
MGNYIERCLHTLFNQTLQNIEFIFIDDYTLDNSIRILEEILEQYPHRKKQTKIIRHQKNRGVAVARTSGIEAATGEYIIHCDPDDYIEYNMYEKLYKCAKTNNADIITCNHFLNDKPVKYNYYKTPQECLKNLYKKNSHYVHLVTKLIKADLIDKYNISPFQNIDFEEDLNLIIQFFHYAKKIAIVNEPLYHYCLRENSLSTSLFKKFDSVRLKSLEANLSFLRKQGKGEYRKLEDYLIYKIKFSFPEIFNNEKDWFNWHKECHKNILSFDEETFKNRAILWISMKNYNLFNLLKKFIPSLNYVRR